MAQWLEFLKHTPQSPPTALSVANSNVTLNCPSLSTTPLLHRRRILLYIKLGFWVEVKTYIPHWQADDDNSDHGSSGGDDDDSDDNNNSDGDGCNDSDDDDDRNDSDDGDCYSNDDDSNGTDIRGDEALARAIEQVNVQAAFTFDLLPNGEPSYYAFIIALDRFSLLHYIRPGTNKQAGGGMAGEEDHEADPGLDIPGLPPMPDIPKVVYWNQLIFTPGMKGFSTVFLDALACATKHLGLNHQPSWFDPKPGTTHGTRLREEFEQFLQREQVC
ncbi:uncharacterized protein PHACADRAFT_257516 [Phanerochaete carnosa HHB-10118-sp]|uniref:Uncharacterized protein n=1 Tax=Phanerochaete carnosa (strain HHB-10118-sp) TaxID=650164 RepID=K5W4W1_PHACS|nr:uncharacterized protein PHACADRAFT_257516 [Phanerochaete carnosa HHB-10118-sp]EKM53979.1 hypothetical protein PHACADRAFT_257516 [Phanerochaete carnosa HHB-10118-sp]